MWDAHFNRANKPRGSFRSILGYANESLAIGRALQCGYNLFFKAWRDSPYDAVLDFQGILFRIEIKGTQTPALSVTSGGRAGRQISREVASREQVLQKVDADVLIGIRGRDGDCYLIPIEVIQIINRKSINLSRLENFREKWGIFAGTSEFGPSRIRDGFLDLPPQDLRDLCSSLGIPEKANWPGVTLSPHEQRALSTWLHIYNSIE
jgi:hypothetical protein